MNRRTSALALAPVVALTLAGCGSGRHNENYLEKSVINGVNYHSGGLGIYDAIISHPAEKGGTTQVLFDVYADSPGDATTLSQVSAPAISSAAATLDTVSRGTVEPVQQLVVGHQATTGSTLTQATLSKLSAAVVAGGYYDVTFTFANGLTPTLRVPVALNGAVNPQSTTPPTSFPEQPFVVNSNAPLP